MILGVLFDFDGTLIDTMKKFQILAGQILFETYQIPIKEGEKLYLETSGVAFERQIEIICPNGEKNKETVARFEREKLLDIQHEKFDNDVLLTFQKLKEKNIKTGISSGNYLSVMEDFLKKEPLDLDVVMGHEPHFEKGKAHFEYFLQKTNLKKENILFVGDSIKDGERAYDFGIPFIAKEGIFDKNRFLKEFGKSQKTIQKISEVLLYI